MLLLRGTSTMRPEAMAVFSASSEGCEARGSESSVPMREASLLAMTLSARSSRDDLVEWRDPGGHQLVGKLCQVNHWYGRAHR